MPDRTVVVLNPGGGPSPGASAVWLPGEKILFAGDYVLVRTAPEITEQTDLGAWIVSLERLAGLDDEFRVIPGVGGAAGSECIGWLRDYLRELHESTTSLAAAGGTTA